MSESACNRHNRESWCSSSRSSASSYMDAAKRLQLAEQSLPGFAPSEYLTERGRQIYDMARTACYGEMANAVTSRQVSSRVALAKRSVACSRVTLSHPGISNCSTCKADLHGTR